MSLPDCGYGWAMDLEGILYTALRLKDVRIGTVGFYPAPKSPSWVCESPNIVEETQE